LQGQANCACDAGYQDNDNNGSCSPTCATAALSCDANQICSDRFGTAECQSATKPPIYFSFHWHMHQPIYWPYESIVQTEQSGRLPFSVYAVHHERTGPYTSWPKDAIDAGKSFAHLGAQVSLSGSLMENLSNLAAAGAGFSGWTAPWLEAAGLSTTLGNPRLDLVSFGYHHPLMGLLDTQDLRLQLATHRAALQRYLPGVRQSKGLFPPECAISERMIPALCAEGVEWALVDNIHFDRAHRDYPYKPESNLVAPNAAEQINDAATDWVQLTGLWAPSPVSAPWGYQPHYIEYTDPATGTKSRIVAVPAARYEGNEDARGGFGALQYEAVFSQLERYNTDPLHPILVVLHHDGDNYGGGTESYYHGNFGAMLGWLAQNPTRFVATTIQDYLDQFPPEQDDVIHIEDGAWSGAANGDPEFQKWNGDPAADGYSPDRHSWAVITAVKNRVLTAAAITPASSLQAIIDGPAAANANNTDKAWHYLQNAETSCYWYWDNTQNGVWDSHPSRAGNLAAGFADLVLQNGTDSVPPTIYLPQREPYNPGVGTAPSDFQVWTLAYDVSGLQSVTLRYRIDADGVRDAANDAYAGGSWSQATMQASTISSRTDPAPTYKAELFSTTIAGLSNVLVDYYVAATDNLGLEGRSPLQHVWVGQKSTQSGLWEPQSPTKNDPIVLTWNQPAKLHWGVDGWNKPPAEYWTQGSVLWSDGRAIESPLSGPDIDGHYHLTIGPFNQTAVAAVNFVFHNDNNTWSSPDQTITITP
jgi:hypothetical protein